MKDLRLTYEDNHTLIRISPIQLSELEECDEDDDFDDPIAQDGRLLQELFADYPRQSQLFAVALAQAADLEDAETMGEIWPGYGKQIEELKAAAIKFNERWEAFDREEEVKLAATYKEKSAAPTRRKSKT